MIGAITAGVFGTPVPPSITVDYLVIAGGGGSGGTYNTTGALTSGSGSPGIVIVRYLGSQGAVGGSVSSSGGYTIHTFTGDGTFRANSAPVYAVN